MRATKVTNRSVADRKATSRPDPLDDPKLRRAPVQRRAQDRIDAILSATEEAIVTGGNGSLSIFDIAARAGITSTSIYHYFKSIDEILVMLMWREVAGYAAEINAMLAKASSVPELIESWALSKRLGWDKYRNTPIARGLWARARLLTTARRLDEEYNTQRTDLVCARFRELAPDADHDAIRAVVSLTVALGVPTYEFAMTQPKRRQNRLIEEFIAMTQARLIAVVG